MKAVCFGSPKGGVGKTTLVANIAYALQRLGMKVVAIDFDPQNALRHHFGIDLDDGRGYASGCLATDDWRPFLRETRSGVRLLPFGDASHAERHRFDRRLEQDPGFLAERLRTLAFGEANVVLLADTPPGGSPALTSFCRLHPLCIAVLLADTASAVLLPPIERGAFFGSNLVDRTFYVVNQYDIRSALNRDVSAFLRERLGAKLLQFVHRDEAVKEAHARQISLFQHAYTSAAVEDLTDIARNLQRLLSVGDDADGEGDADDANGVGDDPADPCGRRFRVSYPSGQERNAPSSRAAESALWRFQDK